MNHALKRAASLALVCVLALPAVSCKNKDDSDQIQHGELTFNDTPVDEPDLPEIPSVPSVGSTAPAVTTVTDESGNAYVYKTDAQGSTVTQSGGEPETELYTAAPPVTTATDESGNPYVYQTDPSGSTVTEAGGSVLTEPYVETTAAAQNPGSSQDYTPAYKSYISMWMDTSQQADFVFDGEFLIFDLTISEDAKDGIYPLEFYHLDFANYNAETIPCTATTSYVCVNSDEPEQEQLTGDGMKLETTMVSGKPGDTVPLVVTLKDNPGIAGFVLKMLYDSNIVTVSNAKSGKDFSSYVRVINNEADS